MPQGIGPHYCRFWCWYWRLRHRGFLLGDIVPSGFGLRPWHRYHGERNVFRVSKGALAVDGGGPSRLSGEISASPVACICVVGLLRGNRSKLGDDVFQVRPQSWYATTDYGAEELYQTPDDDVDVFPFGCC